MSDSPGGANPYAAPDEQPAQARAGASPAPAPSGYEAVPPAPSGYEAVPPTPSYGSAPVPPYGSAPVPPYGSAPVPPYGSAPVPPYGSAPVPPYGSAPVPPYGSAPVPPYGSAPEQPYGAAPAYGSAAAPGYPAPTYGAPYGSPASPYGTSGPTYGSPYPGAPGPHVDANPGTDGLAVGSLVTSIAGLVVFAGIPSPVGLGLGIASLRRIRRTGAGGRGMAIAGVVVGGFGTLCLLGFVAMVLWMLSMYQTDPEFREAFDEGWSEGTSGDASGSTEDPYYELRTDLTVGTCIAAYPAEYDMSDAELVDCATPHDTEVVGTVQLTAPVTTDPEDSGYSDAVDACVEQIDAAAPGLLDIDGFADVYTPHPDDFAEPGGDAAWCVFVSDGESLTGSIAGGDLAVGVTAS
ncbi:hypothetical protein Cch01nite_40160 [Cellulomonas chitinilytica]|uniref:DUF4190 domain-containing protein n=1 Tax=Cellulomonas chitinilytica TaxID=398759 RepID=A0A919P4M5_9CELL|nr:DUF4190 domain-containing protein [Cellulomonas chitinilytica]GIG23292.1 hypothetical protein Cch01nite_40160 [Cellulomonas chitinilytica]